MFRLRSLILPMLVSWFASAGCATMQVSVPVASPAPDEIAVPTFTATSAIAPTVGATSTALSIPTATPTPAPTVAPTASPTPDPYAGWTVLDLAGREYGAGELEVVEILGSSEAFTRSLIRYTSDGLSVYGFMNVPPGEGPFPVVIVNHGYIDPAVYSTLTYTTRYADAFARNGYIAIHPNFRNYPPSDPGPNEFRAGYAIDVLNLVGLVGKLGGAEGALATADPDRIGLWGHSMGGGVTLRSVTVSAAIDAAVLYGSMSGDEARNHERILYFSSGSRGQWSEDERPPDADLLRISPIFHLDRVQAPVSIHHGTLDDQVPLAWSTELCERLTELQKVVECFTYEGQPHTFVGDGDALFIARTVEFFDSYLK